MSLLSTVCWKLVAVKSVVGIKAITRGLGHVFPTRRLRSPWSLVGSLQPPGEQRHASTCDELRRCLDLAIGTRIDQALVTVVEADQVWRATVVATHFDDLAVPVGCTH